MKFKNIMGLLLAALLIGMPGCSTTESGKKVFDVPTAEKLAPILSGSVAGAVVYAYSKNPKTEIYVGVIRTALQEFLISTNMSAAALQAKIYSLPIKELQTVEAQLIISPLLATYKGFADQKVKEGLDKNPGLKLLIQGMIDGLDQGIIGINGMKGNPPPSADISDHDALKIVFESLDKQMQASGG